MRLSMIRTHSTLLRGIAAAAAIALAGGAVLQSPPALAQSAPQPRTGLPDFTELVEQVGPAVVNIRTLERARGGGAQQQGQADDEMQELFRRFFGVPMPNAPNAPNGPRAPRAPNRPGGEGEEQPRGVGSGFILSQDGFVMTNAHVVEGADEVLVTLPDNREFKARIVGADKRTDVAVVKIEATGLPFVKVGDVSKLKVGEWVLAIGSPFGLENTVTAGIVSAKQRETGQDVSFIQTDVAVNPGNSGGPLISLRGEVVGINSQSLSRVGYGGISFAIPIDEAIRVADQLRASGHVVRGYLGILPVDVPRELADEYKLGKDKARGAFVRQVVQGTPADKAGVQPGDV